MSDVNSFSCMKELQELILSDARPDKSTKQSRDCYSHTSLPN